MRLAQQHALVSQRSCILKRPVPTLALVPTQGERYGFEPVFHVMHIATRARPCLNSATWSSRSELHESDVSDSCQQLVAI